MGEQINKREWELLGRVFARETEGLPLQSKARGYQALCERGMVERAYLDFGTDRFGPLRAEGWVLTPRGHIFYCEACQWYTPTTGEGGGRG